MSDEPTPDELKIFSADVAIKSVEVLPWDTELPVASHINAEGIYV
jgi:hypothetical protein